MLRFAWQNWTFTCRIHMPLPATAIRTKSHFLPAISAVSVFTSATTCLTPGGSVRSCAIANLNSPRRKENLARLTDEVELAVQTAYNKLERTDQLRKVSQEVLALRTESNRLVHQELVHGEALASQADMGTAQELDAQTLLLQSQLDYMQANDEIIHAIGQTPR